VSFPREADILLLIQHGPPDSPYVGGEYHGVLLFPSEYPFKPPGIKVSRVVLVFVPHVHIKRPQMFTPSGRFQPDKKICFSMSDFHPGSVCRSSLMPCIIDADLLKVESSMERCHDVSLVP
jgi:ubiquitin-conjugating enzyme E2 J2